MDLLRQRYLRAMGVQAWVRRAAPQVAVAVPRGSVSLGAAPVVTEDTPGLDWEALRQRVAVCTACALHATRTQTVFGVGDRQARWMVVGEAPGADEDRQGEPFVGRAGRLLNAMLAALGLRREQVYIANTLKCRPPRNRDPEAVEVVACEGYLRRQIVLIQPRLIIAVGRVAAHILLKTDLTLARMRGRVHSYPDTEIPVVVTYHPAYLLRNPVDKRKAWEDLCFALSVASPLP